MGLIAPPMMPPTPSALRAREDSNHRLPDQVPGGSSELWSCMLPDSSMHSSLVHSRQHSLLHTCPHCLAGRRSYAQPSACSWTPSTACAPTRMPASSAMRCLPPLVEILRSVPLTPLGAWEVLLAAPISSSHSAPSTFMYALFVTRSWMDTSVCPHSRSEDCAHSGTAGRCLARGTAFLRYAKRRQGKWVGGLQGVVTCLLPR